MPRYGQVLLCFLFAGCVSTGNSELASDQTMAQIRVGETTKQQVAALLGEPASQRTIEMGGWAREWWSYDHGSSVINVLDYIFLYGFFFNGIGLHDTRYDVGVFFDQRGVVSSLSRLKTDYDMGRPFSSKRVASSATKTMGFPDSSKAPVRFEDKAEYQY